MQILRPIGLVDVWPLSHSLYAQQHRLGKAVDGVRRLPLMQDGKRMVKDWRNAAVFLARAQRLIEEHLPALQIARAELEMLDPYSGLPWTLGAQDEAAVHVGIVTNPGARLYAGLEAWSVGWGECLLSAPDARTLHSAVNMGDVPRVHLILRLRAKPVSGVVEPPGEALGL